MTGLNPTHRGVLVPDDLLGASVAELDVYADRVKRGNREFVEAVFALEAEAERLGVDLGAER